MTVVEMKNAPITFSHCTRDVRSKWRPHSSFVSTFLGFTGCLTCENLWLIVTGIIRTFSRPIATKVYHLHFIKTTISREVESKQQGYQTFNLLSNWKVSYLYWLRMTFCFLKLLFLKLWHCTWFVSDEVHLIFKLVIPKARIVKY